MSPASGPTWSASSSCSSFSSCGPPAFWACAALGQSSVAETATSPVSPERPESPPARLAGALRGDWWALGVFALVLAIAPLVQGTSYYHGILVTFTINLILLIGLNLIAGYANQLSLGHAGFYGLGAYTAGIVSVKLGWPPVLGLLLAPLVVAAVSLLVG